MWKGLENGMSLRYTLIEGRFEIFGSVRMLRPSGRLGDLGMAACTAWKSLKTLS